MRHLALNPFGDRNANADQQDVFFLDLHNSIITVVVQQTEIQAPRSENGKYRIIMNDPIPPHPWNCWCPSNPNNSHACPHEPSFMERCDTAPPYPWGCWCPLDPNASHLCPYEPSYVLGQSAFYHPCTHAAADFSSLHRTCCVRPATAAHKFIRWFRYSNLWRRHSIEPRMMALIREKLALYYNHPRAADLLSPAVAQEHCELIVRIVLEFTTMRHANGRKNRTWNPMIHGVLGWADLPFADCVQRVVNGMIEMKRLRLRAAEQGRQLSYMNGL